MHPKIQQCSAVSTVGCRGSEGRRCPVSQGESVWCVRGSIPAGTHSVPFCCGLVACRNYFMFFQTSALKKLPISRYFPHSSNTPPTPTHAHPTTSTCQQQFGYQVTYLLSLPPLPPTSPCHPRATGDALVLEALLPSRGFKQEADLIRSALQQER